jgi:hypothetical protein
MHNRESAAASLTDERWDGHPGDRETRNTGSVLTQRGPLSIHQK